MELSMLSLLSLSPLQGLHSFSELNPRLTPGATLCRPLRGLVGHELLSVLAGLLLLTGALSTAFAQTDNSHFPRAAELQHDPPLTRQVYAPLRHQCPPRT